MEGGGDEAGPCGLALLDAMDEEVDGLPRRRRGVEIDRRERRVAGAGQMAVDTDGDEQVAGHVDPTLPRHPQQT
ncbi:hypothetical protein GCM10018965_042140 [Nonomuraea roseola]